MRLQELFLVETTEEDRALISLSSAIYNKVSPYTYTDIDYDDEDQQLVTLGKIGDLFDTPITVLDDVRIEIQGGEPFIKRVDDIPSTESIRLSSGRAMAFWDDTTKAIVLNADYIDSYRMRTTITHELRHALDEIKSDSFGSGEAKNYFLPKKKEHRDGINQYKAQPAEINARFVEILDLLANRIIPRASELNPNNIKEKVLHDFNHLLLKYDIADLFPEKSQSKDYKRLIKRAVDFIDKELEHRLNK
jgi:hypothetical protein